MIANWIRTDPKWWKVLGRPNSYFRFGVAQCRAMEAALTDKDKDKIAIISKNAWSILAAANKLRMPWGFLYWYSEEYKKRVRKDQEVTDLDTVDPENINVEQGFEHIQKVIVHELTRRVNTLKDRQLLSVGDLRDIAKSCTENLLLIKQANMVPGQGENITFVSNMPFDDDEEKKPN